MKSGLVVLGVIVLLVGLVWIGQGLGYIRGSFMTGDLKWFWIGVGMVVVGLAVGGFGALRRGQSKV
jgi:hypothetical protein